MYRIQRQYGIGLLELMLSMVIIAILTLMSIQYFGSSKMNTQTNKVVEEIQNIISIVSGFPNPIQLQNGKANSNGDPNLNNAVIMSGELPQEYIIDSVTIGTPWKNGRITVFIHQASNPKARVLAVSLKSIPNWGCQSIIDKMRAEIFAFAGGKPDCTKKNDSSVGLYFQIVNNQGI